MKSFLFTLQMKDLLRGILMAFGTAFFTTLTLSINSGALPTLAQLKIAAVAGVSAIVFYIGKNFFTDDTKTAMKTIDQAGGKVLEKTDEEKRIDAMPKPILMPAEQ